jgi:hypothetical protein
VTPNGGPAASLSPGRRLHAHAHTPRLRPLTAPSPTTLSTQTTTGSTRYEPLANAAGSSAPYARSLGGVISAPTPNLSQFRPRAYGESNNVFPESKPNEELYYTQPGWPLDKRNAALRPGGRKGRVGWSLKDTPLTIKARAAAKHGMSVADYERYSDPFSPSRVAALLAGGAPGGPGAVTDGERDALAAALPGAELPTDPAAARVAAALAAGDAVPSDAPGTFAAAVSSTLTPEEEAFLGCGHDAVDLVGRAAQYQEMIDRYASGAGGKVSPRRPARRGGRAVDARLLPWRQAAPCWPLTFPALPSCARLPLPSAPRSRSQEAAKGVERAVAARDEVLATLGRLRGIHAKLASLEAAFEVRAQEEAAKATAAAEAQA